MKNNARLIKFLIAGIAATEDEETRKPQIEELKEVLRQTPKADIIEGLLAYLR